jgi:ribosomal protein S18 acetylase RimI-like enzyme
LAIGEIKAQSPYEKGMKAALEQLFSADGGKENWQNAANKLERIANVEKDKWQPHYYAALAYAWMATKEETLTLQDEKMNRARKFVETGLEVSPDNVELITMQGYADMLSIAFDPATRGQTLSTRVFQTFGKAIQMDPANPRARLFMAQMQDGTESFFGQGHEGSCQTLTKAVENYALQKDNGDFSPTWGQGAAEHMLKNCQKSAAEDGN